METSPAPKPASFLDQVRERVLVDRTRSLTPLPSPMTELRARGEIRQVGNGLFVIEGRAAVLLERLEALFDGIAREFDCTRAAVPSVLDWASAERSNYLNSFGNQALVLRRSAAADAPTPVGLSCPTVCYHYFASLHGATAPADGLITAQTKCTRHEEGELNDLSRLVCFTMREIVGFGSEEFCRARLHAIRERTQQLLDERLELSYRVQTAADPFFGRDQDLKKKVQLLHEAKFEIQADLPFKGQSVAIASFNFHGDVFYQRFGITPSSAGRFSFCVGYGFERILFAVLSQHGCDFDSAFYQRLLAG